MEKIYSQLGPESVKIVEGMIDKLFNSEHIALGEEMHQKFFSKYPEMLQQMINELLALWNTKEHMETLGHDKVHISYDLFEFLQLAQSGALKESEKVLTLFGVLLHDLGRYPELLFEERSEGMNFDLPKQIQFHAALSGHMWMLIFDKHHKKWELFKETDPDITQAAEAFFYRIMGAVLYHGGRNEERDIVAHHVQSCDRLAGILGTREFVRNVVTDGVQRGAVVYPDDRLSYDKTFPLFNNLPVEEFQNSEVPEKSWTNIVHYLEMPLRNMFPLSTEFGMKRSEAMKRESGIILTLLSGGVRGAVVQTVLYNPIFATELNREEKYKFPKTPIPEEIWQSIKLGIYADDPFILNDYAKFSLSTLIDLMLDQQAPDISKDEKSKVHDLLNVQEHEKDVRYTLQYIVARRELNRKAERRFLEVVSRSNDLLIKSIANELMKSQLWVELSLSVPE
jgi:hypothetical protein